MDGVDPEGVATEGAGADETARACGPPARRRRCTLSCARWPTARATCRCCERSSRPTSISCSCPGAASGPKQESAARGLAAAALANHLASGRPDHDLAPEERRRIFGFLAGPGVAEHWEGFLTEELALEGSDPREPSWRLADIDPDGSFRCAVIGAGASGLAAAHRLRQAGVAATVFEKNGDVGGTWLENVYPGCRVDVPNQLYSFSFAQTNDWVSRFSAQPDLLAYLQSTAKDLGLGECIRFRSEVTEARFDDTAREWSLTVRAGDGTEVTEVVDGVVCAVGQLNRPSFPAIDGQERFVGPSFHSADWDDTVELAGRRVGVIGTGASAAQFVPRLAGEVGHLDVYQRTPPWLLPTDNYGDPFPPEFHDLLQLLPGYGRWDRLWQFWLMHEGLLVAARVDPGWDAQTEAVSAENDFVRSMLLDVLRAQVADDALYEKDGPALPALRQTRPARRRAMGGGAEPSRRRPGDDADRRDHATRGADGGRRGAAGGRVDLRDGIQRVGLRRAHEGLRRRRRGAQRGVGR